MMKEIVCMYRRATTEFGSNNQTKKEEKNIVQYHHDRFEQNFGLFDVWFERREKINNTFM